MIYRELEKAVQEMDDAERDLFRHTATMEIIARKCERAAAHIREEYEATAPKRVSHYMRKFADDYLETVANDGALQRTILREKHG